MTLPHSTSDSAAESTSQDAGQQKKLHKARNVLIIVASLVLAAALLAGCYLWNLAHTFESNSQKIQAAFPAESLRPQKTEAPDGQKSAVNILVMGSDSRGASSSDAEEGAATDQRADTLMLVHLPADRKNVFAISIMRDLWVPIPGSGEAKINAALAVGGVPKMVETVESVFNQRIDHVAMVDFESFKSLTDALGGVEVHVKVPFTSTHGNFTFTAGSNIMQGEQALGFVRERYAFADGDYQRVRNQQLFLRSVLGKLIDTQTLSNPVTVSNIVGSVSPFVSLDSELNAATLVNLGVELSGVRRSDITMFTLPTLGTGTSSDGQSIVLKNPEAIANISGALASDSLGRYIAANNFQNGN